MERKVRKIENFLIRFLIKNLGGEKERGRKSSEDTRSRL